MVKFLHTRIRVSKPQESIDFYTKLGFELGKQKTSPQGNQLAFMHLPDSEHFLELTYSPEFEVKFPEDLMHTCVGVPDVIAYRDKLENDGIEEDSESLESIIEEKNESPTSTETREASQESEAPQQTDS